MTPMRQYGLQITGAHAGEHTDWIGENLHYNDIDFEPALHLPLCKIGVYLYM